MIVTDFGVLTRRRIMCRIGWRSNLTGAEGHGEWFPESERATLQAWIDEHKEDETLIHWIETEK